MNHDKDQAESSWFASQEPEGQDGGENPPLGLDEGERLLESCDEEASNLRLKRKEVESLKLRPAFRHTA